MSDLQGAGLWSDFENFGGQFRKTYQKMRLYVYIEDLKSDCQNNSILHRDLCSNTFKSHIVFNTIPSNWTFSYFDLSLNPYTHEYTYHMSALKDSPMFLDCDKSIKNVFYMLFIVTSVEKLTFY